MTGLFVAWNERGRHGLAGWVEDGAGCHIWMGGRTQNGYGTTHINKKTVLITRTRYEKEVGPIPKGMDLDHYICDNGPGGCCNPLHMRPASRRENTLRGNGASSRNLARTRCPRGHELSGDNLVKSVLAARGSRICRTCHNAACRVVYHKRRAAMAHARRNASVGGASALPRAARLEPADATGGTMLAHAQPTEPKVAA